MTSGTATVHNGVTLLDLESIPYVQGTWKDSQDAKLKKAYEDYMAAVKKTQTEKTKRNARNQKKVVEENRRLSAYEAEEKPWYRLPGPSNLARSHV